MLQDEIEGKRLLLVGGIGSCRDLISLAHRNGVFIGVADYNKDTPVKRLADAAYDVNALDVDALVELCEKEHYDGVITNFSDMLSPYVANVAGRLGSYVPYTVEQLRLSTDKKFFKDTCVKWGVTVPQEYDLAQTDVSEIQFPVILKPVDGSGSKGITVCHDASELQTCMEQTQNASRSGRMICEQYLPFEEINLTYIIQNGEPQLAAVHDRLFHSVDTSKVRVPDLYIYPSRYTDLVLEKFNPNIIRMLKGEGLRNGSMFIQAIVKDDVVYLYEAGMRLNGCKTYQILEREAGFNTFERLMGLALTGSMGDYCNFDPHMKKWYATWNVVGRPGATISRIDGVESLEAEPWMVHVAQTYQVGETVPNNSAGTLVQLLARIHVSGDTKEDLTEHLRELYARYIPYDTEGNICREDPFDPDELAEILRDRY